MLPPIDPRILRENPKFAKLYTHLTTHCLNPDGSTKDPEKARQLAEMREVSLSAGGCSFAVRDCSRGGG
jgi:hypothetical protein